MLYAVGQIVVSKGPIQSQAMIASATCLSGAWYKEEDITRLFDAVPIVTILEQWGRWKQGVFTDAEVQNICHNLQGEKCAFFDGCAEQQKKLFGISEREEKDAEINRLKAQRKRRRF